MWGLLLLLKKKKKREVQSPRALFSPLSLGPIHSPVTTGLVWVSDGSRPPCRADVLYFSLPLSIIILVHQPQFILNLFLNSKVILFSNVCKVKKKNPKWIYTQQTTTDIMFQPGEKGFQFFSVLYMLEFPFFVCSECESRGLWNFFFSSSSLRRSNGMLTHDKIGKEEGKRGGQGYLRRRKTESDERNIFSVYVFNSMWEKKKPFFFFFF